MANPVPLSVELTKHYQSLHHFSTSGYIPFDTEVSIICADYYDDMVNDLTSIFVRKSYESFKNHIVEQFKLLAAAGFEFIDGKGIHSYQSSDELRKDMSAGKIIYRPTYSENSSISEISWVHPLAERAVIDGNSWIVNDIFRIVHDFYGHGLGHGFSPEGEHHSWLAHRSILPVEARVALFCETRGQSSWVNFGRHIRASERYIPPSERPFAPQKTGIIPDYLI